MSGEGQRSRAMSSLSDGARARGAGTRATNWCMARISSGLMMTLSGSSGLASSRTESEREKARREEEEEGEEVEAREGRRRAAAAGREEKERSEDRTSGEIIELRRDMAGCERERGRTLEGRRPRDVPRPSGPPPR